MMIKKHTKIIFRLTPLCIEIYKFKNISNAVAVSKAFASNDD